MYIKLLVVAIVLLHGVLAVELSWSEKLRDAINIERKKLGRKPIEWGGYLLPHYAKENVINCVMKPWTEDVFYSVIEKIEPDEIVQSWVKYHEDNPDLCADKTEFCTGYLQAIKGGKDYINCGYKDCETVNYEGIIFEGHHLIACSISEWREGFMKSSMFNDVVWTGMFRDEINLERKKLGKNTLDWYEWDYLITKNVPKCEMLPRTKYIFNAITKEPNLVRLVKSWVEYERDNPEECKNNSEFCSGYLMAIRGEGSYIRCESRYCEDVKFGAMDFEFYNLVACEISQSCYGVGHNLEMIEYFKDQKLPS